MDDPTGGLIKKSSDYLDDLFLEVLSGKALEGHPELEAMVNEIKEKRVSESGG